MKDKETTGHLSGQQILDKSGKSPDAIRKKLVRLSEKHPDVFPDASWNIDRTFNPDQVRMIVGRVSGRRPAKKTKPVSTVPPTAPDKATPAPARSFPTFTQVRTFFFDALAVGVVVGHGFLIWQEAAELYGYIGAIGGLVVFFVVCLAVLLASDPAKNRTSEYALWFMLLVDAAAGRVHFEALARPSVPFSITVGFCIFICACSWVALLLYRDSKQD